MEKKESGRQTLSVKTREKKQGPRLKSKEKEAAKTGCYFIKFILSPVFLLHSKIHYYTRQSMGNYSQSPKSDSLTSLSADVEKFVISFFASVFAERKVIMWREHCTLMRCNFSAETLLLSHRLWSWWVTFTWKINNWSRRLKVKHSFQDK